MSDEPLFKPGDRVRAKDGRVGSVTGPPTYPATLNPEGKNVEPVQQVRYPVLFVGDKNAVGVMEADLQPE